MARSRKTKTDNIVLYPALDKPYYRHVQSGKTTAIQCGKIAIVDRTLLYETNMVERLLNSWNKIPK